MNWLAFVITNPSVITVLQDRRNYLNNCIFIQQWLKVISHKNEFVKILSFNKFFFYLTLLSLIYSSKRNFCHFRISA